jgi:hypothetical protein
VMWNVIRFFREMVMGYGSLRLGGRPPFDKSTAVVLARLRRLYVRMYFTPFVYTIFKTHLNSCIPRRVLVLRDQSKDPRHIVTDSSWKDQDQDRNHR